MQLAHYSTDDLKRQVLAIISRHVDHLNQYHVFFFGSRLKGNTNEGADIDIGIEGDEPVPLSSLSGISE